MNTRKAEHSDLFQLSTLFDAYRQFYGKDLDPESARLFINERLSLKDSELFVVVSNESVVGFAQLYPSFSSVSMQRIYILNDLFVSLENRKQGAGTALLKAAEEFAKEQNALRISLATEVTNDVARSLYEMQNWEEDEAFVHYNRYVGSA